ncbi:MAG: DUF3168 domain-containing protein [Rickettsiales bacterium]
MSDPVWKWQAALYNLAKNDATLNAAVGGRIYLRPPSKPECPYVYFGEVELEPEPLYSDVAEKISTIAYVVSSAPDLHETTALMYALRRAIDGKNVSVTGYHVMGVHYGGRKTYRPDTERRVGEMRWIGLLDPKNA